MEPAEAGSRAGPKKQRLGKARSAFSAEEDADLSVLARKHKVTMESLKHTHGPWDKIATELRTQRTSDQCRERFYKKSFQHKQMNNREYDPRSYTADQQAALVVAMQMQDSTSTPQQPKYKYYEKNQRWEWAGMRKDDGVLRDDIEWKDPSPLWRSLVLSVSKSREQDIDEGSEPLKFFCKAFYATLQEGEGS